MPYATCKNEDCKNKAVTRGLCNRHYQVFRRSKEFEFVPRTLTCTVDECGKKSFSRGLCQPHYRRMRLYGNPMTVLHASDAEEAFRLRTEWQGNCLIWTGARTTAGYGTIRANGAPAYAHRWAWEQKNGTIPETFEIDHICHNPACVNVDHLRLANRLQNGSNLAGPNSNNKSSGIRNVYRKGKKWRVIVGRDGRQYNFGTYDSIEEAAEVAEQARRDLFGDFAGLG